VQFDDNDGNPISGIADQPLDGTGSVNLQGLKLNSATGLPQFLITLNGTSGTPGEVVVKLTWTAAYDPSCVAPTAENVKISTPPSGGTTTPSSAPPTFWTLTVAPTGEGTGTVTDSAKAISCKPTCSHRYTDGTVVTLSPHPGPGSTFVGWRGACSGKGACKVVMNAAKTVTAVFNRLPRETTRLRFGGEKAHGPGAVTGIAARPERPGCVSELAFIADVGCNSTELTVSGSIAKHATGNVLVTVYGWFGKRRATGKVSEGHWVVHLSVPGINQDPRAPKYLLVVHYAGNGSVRPGSRSRRVRIEVERTGLGAP
jgi:hypothetical protein